MGTITDIVSAVVKGIGRGLMALHSVTTKPLMDTWAKYRAAKVSQRSQPGKK